MKARGMMSRVALRTSKALALAALAVGLATAALAPTAALAADGHPDLVVSMESPVSITADERVTLPITIVNEGAATTDVVEVTIAVGMGYDTLAVEDAYGQSWSCSNVIWNRRQVSYESTCQVQGLEHSEKKMLQVSATPRKDGQHWISAEADPLNHIDDAKRSNNFYLTGQHI